MPNKFFAPDVIEGPYTTKREYFWVAVGSIATVMLCAICVALIVLR